jgi:dTDP-glucose pyrophosphorylase
MQNSLPETERQKRDSERIKKLEAELTSVNRQLVTNRKLFAKIKVKGSSKESSTSVESDLKIATITEENKTLSKKIEDLQNETLSYKNC